ncbi:MAG: DUF4886 domain-containing protein [Bacteroidota bacterium]
MKKLIWLPLLLTLFCTSLLGQKRLDVLFIGNSYTYVNDLPGLITQLALSKGDTLVHDENTMGGSTLQVHSTNATTLGKINAKPWDFVVLQEQSQLPAFPPSQVATEVYPYADSLNKYIKKNDSCTQTIFFMTWGRKNGDASNCASYPPICTYEGMQASIRSTYLQMSQTLHAAVAPVGVAWKKVRNEGDSIELYNADESHPSLAGSYLAACTFYASMFHKSPLGGAYPAGLNPATALHLQQYANKVVFDSLNLWKIDTLTAHAAFATNINLNTITIANNSVNADAYYWDFGDGQNAWGNITSHSYDAVGSYYVLLVAFRGCTTDTIIKTVNITTVGINNYEFASQINLFPDPASEYIVFNHSRLVEGFTYRIFNAEGMVVLNGTSIANSKIVVQMLSSGIYFYMLQVGGDTYKGKFQIVR